MEHLPFKTSKPKYKYDKELEKSSAILISRIYSNNPGSGINTISLFVKSQKLYYITADLWLDHKDGSGNILNERTITKRFNNWWPEIK